MKHTTMTIIASTMTGALAFALFVYVMLPAPTKQCEAITENNGTVFCVNKDGATPLKP